MAMPFHEAMLLLAVETQIMSLLKELVKHKDGTNWQCEFSFANDDKGGKNATVEDAIMSLAVTNISVLEMIHSRFVVQKHKNSSVFFFFWIA